MRTLNDNEITQVNGGVIIVPMAIVYGVITLELAIIAAIAGSDHR